MLKKIKNLYNICVGDRVVLVSTAQKGTVINSMSERGIFEVAMDNESKLPVHATNLLPAEIENMDSVIHDALRL